MTSTDFRLPLAFSTKNPLDCTSSAGSTCSSKIYLRPLSSCPLRSADRLYLLLPRTRTSLAQHCAFVSMGSSLWDDLLLAIHELSGVLLLLYGMTSPINTH